MFEEPTLFTPLFSDPLGNVPGSTPDTVPAVNDPVPPATNDDPEPGMILPGLGVPGPTTGAGVGDPGPVADVPDGSTTETPFPFLGVAKVAPDPDPVVGDPGPDEPDDPGPDEPDPVVDDPAPDDPDPVDPAPDGPDPIDPGPGVSGGLQAQADIFGNWPDTDPAGDTFVFDADWGVSTITDFHDGAGIEDVIAFSTSLFADFADLQAHMHQIGDDVVVTDGANTLTITHSDLAQFGVDDFSFF